MSIKIYNVFNEKGIVSISFICVTDKAVPRYLRSLMLTLNENSTTLTKQNYKSKQSHRYLGMSFLCVSFTSL